MWVTYGKTHELKLTCTGWIQANSKKNGYEFEILWSSVKEKETEDSAGSVLICFANSVEFFSVFRWGLAAQRRCAQHLCTNMRSTQIYTLLMPGECTQGGAQKYTLVNRNTAWCTKIHPGVLKYTIVHKIHLMHTNTSWGTKIHPCAQKFILVYKNTHWYTNTHIVT